jgi:hypothetical protein
MSSTKTKSSKNGGALLNDVQNLVVPFGLILAEKGLRQLAKDSKKKVAKTEIKEGQKAAVGGVPAKKGKKKPTEGAKKVNKKKGGSAVESLHNEFSKLSNEIDNFLAKH